jgi:hypothetical protein
VRGPPRKSYILERVFYLAIAPLLPCRRLDGSIHIGPNTLNDAIRVVQNLYHAYHPKQICTAAAISFLIYRLRMGNNPRNQLKKTSSSNALCRAAI